MGSWRRQPALSVNTAQVQKCLEIVRRDARLDGDGQLVDAYRPPRGYVRQPRGHVRTMSTNQHAEQVRVVLGPQRIATCDDHLAEVPEAFEPALLQQCVH